jgi:hypothetical protein
MTQNNEQVPGGYYYAPLKDTGVLQDWFERAGKVMGAAMGAAAGATALALTGTEASSPITGAAVMGSAGEMGSQTMGPVFRDVGFYLDNVDTVIQNLQTFSGEVNDYRSWTTPDIFC